MATYTSENRSFWQGIADDTSKDRPSVGKSVLIEKGRKHKGKSGVVVWHGVNKFANNYYKSDAQLALREIVGREGYSVKVKTDDGETFFVPAEYTKVL